MLYDSLYLKGKMIYFNFKSSTFHDYVSTDYLKSNLPNTRVGLGIARNNDLTECGLINVFLTRANEYVSASGVCVGIVEPNDTIQLVITSDGVGDLITVDTFNTYIVNFFNEG